MSTEYVIFKDHRGIEMSAGEHSTLIDIYIPCGRTSDEYYTGEVENLTAEQVVLVALRLLKVASYVEGSLRGMLGKALGGDSDGPYIRSILKELVAE